MLSLDLLRNVEFRQALAPAAAVTDNTAQVSNIITMQGFKVCTFVVNIGNVADADATTTFLLEDGDDSSLSDNAAVGDDQLHGTEAGADFIFSDDNEVHAIGYHGIKKYCRLTITPAGNTGNLFVSAIAALSGAEQSPVSSDND